MWYLDSSATRHVAPHKDWFIEYTPMSSRKIILVGDDHKCETKGVGTIPIILNNGKYKHIHKVLHVPKMAKNLLSTQEFKKDGLDIHLAKEIFIEDKEGNKITNLVEINALFKIGKHLANDMALVSHLTNKKTNIQVWHERLCHIGTQKMKELKKMDGKIVYIKSELN